MSKDYPRRDVPVPSPSESGCWGSDVIADAIRDVGIRYLFVNPGASFRGLHDSLVNHLGNQQPQMLLVLHEEHGVAMAHGYAKVTGDLCGAIVHSNVGLMHASMAIFNAWADRTPVLVLGATGPRRRGETPSLDRLDTHCAGPGRIGSSFRQMGCAAGIAQSRTGGDRQGGADVEHGAARSHLRLLRRRATGSAGQ